MIVDNAAASDLKQHITAICMDRTAVSAAPVIFKRTSIDGNGIIITTAQRNRTAKMFVPVSNDSSAVHCI